MNDTLNVLKQHRSIRRFSGQPVEQTLVQDIVRCGQHAASSSHIQACCSIQIKLVTFSSPGPLKLAHRDFQK
ncbi:nitroreductase family protein [Acidithiobacillus thiooxidans]|uniref:nitroreductase family protein n=1 Tax=Acidithiobacillus thiooxidans TaxID=930 RepID=UPI002467E255|nr:nitroreductase family protein [Acidithiobacillus thiooxidans]